MPDKDNCTKEPIKARNYMLAIRSDHAPWKTTEELKIIIEDKLKPQKYGIIRHDKDVDENGNPKPPGDHAMLVFENERHLKATAKKLGVAPENLKIWNDGINNGFGYLIHRTKKAQKEGKYQYDPSEVKANFVFQALMDTIPVEIEQAKQAHDTNPKALLDNLYAGVMTKEEVEARLTGSQYAFYSKKINDVWVKRLQNLADEWRKEMIAMGKQVEVIWIYGDTGTGKTLLAQEIASKKGAFYKSGSQRDTFQRYKGEHTIILDEFREECVKYDEILKILDPFSVQSGGSVGPSRYSDKALAADMFIITTPYNPYQYYKRVVPDKSQQKIDKFDQLLRRLTLILEMDNDNIYPVEMMPVESEKEDQTKQPEKMFEPERIPGVSRPNPYSQAKRPATKPDPKDVFDELFSQNVTPQDTDTNEDTTNDERR